MSKASLLESGGVGAVKKVFVISITRTAPLFIIANKTHMHTHCSRENVAHEITPTYVPVPVSLCAAELRRCEVKVRWQRSCP